MTRSDAIHEACRRFSEQADELERLVEAYGRHSAAAANTVSAARYRKEAAALRALCLALSEPEG